MLEPLPRWLTECAYPFLPPSHRPSPSPQWVGWTTCLRSTTSERWCFRGCSHSLIFRPPSLLSPRSFPPLDNRSIAKGSRDVYVRAQRGLLPPRASDMLAVRIGQLTAKVFHLLDLQPCRPLPWTFTIYSLPVSRRTAAQWLACTIPCRRFADTLAGAAARLGADVDRYSFIVVDSHHLLLASLPAHSHGFCCSRCRSRRWPADRCRTAGGRSHQPRARYRRC